MALVMLAGLAVYATRHMPEQAVTSGGGSSTASKTTPGTDIPGAWGHSTQTSALDGSITHAFTLASSNRNANSIGVALRSELQILCLKNETRLIIDANSYMGMDPITTSFRIDQKPLRRERASVSADGRVFGWWNGNGIPILQAMRGSTSFVIAAPPWGQEAQESVFDITGIDSVLETIGKACRWK